VSASVKDVREILAHARERLGSGGRRTILFLDEIHRFNKAQQALLPAVEAGIVTLIGDDGEPVFRGELGAAQPHAAVRARTLARGGCADDRRARAGSAPSSTRRSAI
jgi:MoxR-like ATPase